MNKSGGLSGSQSKLTYPPLEVVDSLRLFYPQTWRNKSFLQQKYVQEGLSVRQIADLVISSKELVRSELKREGIPLRNESNHHGRPAQAKFGRKVIKGREADHKAERRVVEAISQMKGEGLSLRAIARCLDQMRVPTKNQGKKWHPEMVKRILEE